MHPNDPGASSIMVAVRVRPFTIREAAQLAKPDDGTVFLGDGSMAAAPTPKLNQRGLRSVIKVVDDRCLVFDPPEDNPYQKFSRSVLPAGRKVKDQVFAFDRIFDDNASQMDVYERTTKGLLDSVLDGYNATVFAYGATGCGKTHTITGTAQQPGIIFLTMQELFEKIGERSDDKATELSLSYLEIYNETIRDLLAPAGSGGKQGLMLREDTHQAVTVAGLSSHHPKDVQEVMDMIVQGNACRTVSATEANAVSSRSHAVLQINVAQRDRNAAVSEPHTMATLSIIDLAGSERASATKNRGDRLLEGANINKSLLALGGCINALCDPHKKNHVPYRNSKLTRLLKFSLGGNCKTVMIVCISPSSAHFDETQNTLRYANRAKNIQTKVTRNVFNVNRHIKDFLVKIDEQMALINDLRAQQQDAEKTFARKLRKQLDKRDAVAREGIQRLRLAYEHALAARQQKIADMKKLRGIERRLATLASWGAAFDGVATAAAADQEEAEDDAAADRDMPAPLEALRTKTRGILAELEHSRQHLHQKIERSNWERGLDSALQHSIEQVTAAAAASGCDSSVSDPSEAIACLTSEVELLKSNFARDAYREVLEYEKQLQQQAGGGGDAPLVQTLLAAQFDMLASLAGLLAMDRDTAVAHGQKVLRRMLDAGTSVAARVVVQQPDAAIAISSSLSSSSSSVAAAQARAAARTSSFSAEQLMFPPSKRGTPRRKRPSLAVSTGAGGAMGGHRPSSRTSLAAASTMPSYHHPPHLLVSPTKASPRRRKALTGTHRKSISFSPMKSRASAIGSGSDSGRLSYGPLSHSASVSAASSSAAFKRSVRWRDDASEEGTLADFARTPQKFDSPAKPATGTTTATDAEGTDPKDEDASGDAAAPDTQMDALRAPVPTMATVLEEDDAVTETVAASPPSPDLPPPMALPAYLSQADVSGLTDEDHDTSDTSILAPPPEPRLSGVADGKSGSAVKPKNRFQAGFLSKAPLRSGSPAARSVSSASGGGSSDTEAGSSGSNRPTPLRDIAYPRLSNLPVSPPSMAGSRIARLSSGSSPRGGPGVAAAGAGARAASLPVDENNPPPSSARKLSARWASPRLSAGATGGAAGAADAAESPASNSLLSDKLGDLSLSGLDAQNLRSALHLAKKAANGESGSSGGVRRISVSGSGGGGSGASQRHHHRASASMGSASAANGISRERRRSGERRKSPPPISCAASLALSSSVGAGGGEGVAGRGLTSGQARRMNMGGSLRCSGSGSPLARSGGPGGRALEAAAARRVTLGSSSSAVLAGKNDAAPAPRAGVEWR